MPRFVSFLHSRAAQAMLALALLGTVGAAPAGGPPIGTPPGERQYPPELVERLRAALAAKGADYAPHTRHRRPDGAPLYCNRLLLENSPYLQQHAHNPVDWYPWGDEAFARARRENKPVLLSVGYSTCHWCHVMEEESFEDEEIATYLNEHYVAVKVDRESRPDVDAVYMNAVQLMTGRGGWPMTVWLTPEREPFYGGSYFPARDGDRGTRTGFLTLLKKLDAAYRDDPGSVVAKAAELRRRIESAATVRRGEELPGVGVLRRAFSLQRRTFDAVNGGFGGAPKFPRSVQLEFLLRYHRRSGSAEALEMVRRTLDAMAAGGIYDQVGGGFHRYSTDARWLVPHFEKMLYDNALLAVAYLEGYQATGDPGYARVAREVLRYVDREMSDPGGGFYSASDADSEGAEGTFFLWTPAQIKAALPPRQARLALAYYGVTPHGNFAGKNILHVAQPLPATAKELGMTEAAAVSDLAALRARLYTVRRERVPPLTDRKVLPAWNGLMISAFARAAQVLADDGYAKRAVAAANFLVTKQKKGKRLQRSFVDGRVEGVGYLNDYAFLIAGLIDLYEATYDARWLREAVALQEVLDEQFADPAGGYFLTPADGEKLLAREKPDYDGAEPSGNSVELLNLLRLGEITTDDSYRQRAEALMRATAGVWREAPTSVPRLLSAIDFWLDRVREIVIVVPDGYEQAEPFLAVLRATFLPNRVLIIVRDGADRKALARLTPLVAEKRALGGAATAYVCERGVCALPATDAELFAKQIAAPVAANLP